MKFIVVIVALLFSFIGCHQGSIIRDYSQVSELKRVSPESQGVSSRAVMDYIDSLMAFPQTEIHSVIILRHGRVISEIYPNPYNPDYGHPLFSCSKTFVAAAIGIAINEELIGLDDCVLDFFPEINRNSLDPSVSRITIEDLLTMRSGLKVDWQIRSDSTNWIRAYFSRPLAFKPGKRFVYDSMNSYILSAIVQRVTGKQLIEYLKEKVFDEMNITEAKWEESPEHISTGGWGLYMKPESMAKFGHLLLCRGMWNRKQLIPAEWVDNMMRKHVKNAHYDNYCFHMWTCSYKGSVRADGAYGQFIYIIPDKDMVITMTQCNNANLKKQEQLIWNILLPGIRDEEHVDEASSKELNNNRLPNYSLPILEGKRDSSIFSNFKGHTIKLKQNLLGWKSIRLSSDSAETIKMVIVDSVGRVGDIALGYHKWEISPIGVLPLNPRINTRKRFSLFTNQFHAGGCYAWKDDGLYVKIHFVDWVSSILLHFFLCGDDIHIVANTNYMDDDILL